VNDLAESAVDLSWLTAEAESRLPSTPLGMALREALWERRHPESVQVGYSEVALIPFFGNGPPRNTGIREPDNRVGL
jgi:hypothetical protein